MRQREALSIFLADQRPLASATPDSFQRMGKTKMWSALIPNALLSWRERRKILRDMRTIAEDELNALALDELNPINQAKIALSLNDTRNALRLWEEATKRYPLFARTSRDSLDILVGLKLFDEAEMLMLEGRTKSPREQFYAGGYASVAEARGDFPVALERWKRVTKDFPGWWKGYVHTSACLRKTGNLDEAEALALAAT